MSSCRWTAGRSQRCHAQNSERRRQLCYDRAQVSETGAAAGPEPGLLCPRYIHRGNLDFAEDVLHIADCGFDQLSVEPVSVQPGCGYELTEEHLPRIEAEYERLSQIMRQRKKEGRPFNFFHFMVDLEQGPCVIKRLRGCGAGYEYVAVTPEGDIYPCHQFVGQEQFRQGSVLDDTMDLDLAKTFSGLNIYTREQCRDCWAKFYCSGGCSAANYLMNGELKKPYELACRMERKRLECAIYLKAAEALERTEQDEQAVQS